MIADMHRARHLAWELPNIGWDVEILAPDISYQPPSCIDDDSREFFREDNVVIHSVASFMPTFFRIARIRTVGWSAFYPMLRVGQKILAARKIDLIYISTAHFPLFLLGPIWKRQFGIPFVLDIHDPCFKGGSLYKAFRKFGIKYAVNHLLSKQIESVAINTASGLIAVSQKYIDDLKNRHGRKSAIWLSGSRHAAVPFGTNQHDLQEAARSLPPDSFQERCGITISYVGAGGWVMVRAFTLICKALQVLRSRRPDLLRGIQFQLYGTILGWQPGDPHALQDIARAERLEGLVVELPYRVTYRQSLELLLKSDGALILGVDDAGYMPSKFFTYALSGKPILASVRNDGPLYARLKESPELGHSIWFGRYHEMSAEDASIVVEQFLNQVVGKELINRERCLGPFLSASMAERHARLFEACLDAPFQP